MPWKVYKSGKQYCVHKKNSDGSKGEKVGCHSSKSEAEDQMAALYASEEKEMKDKETKPIDEKAAEKEVESTQEENQEKMYDEYAEASYTMPSLDAKTFSDLDEQRELEEKKEKFEKQSKDFMGLFENIVYYSDLSFAERATKVVDLAQDYAARIEKDFSEQSEEKDIDDKEGFIEKIAGRVMNFLSKDKDKETSSQNLMVFKDSKGNLRWITRYSNNFVDREKEIIAEKSHKRFVDLVDKGLAPYPELLIWHEKSWKIGDADWLAYDDSGYAIASGTVDKGAEDIAVWLSKRKDLRTSHGMPITTVKRDEQNPSVIVEHETREISILPKSRAANSLTGWYLIEKDLQEDNDMIPEKKKEQLEKNWGIESSILESLEKVNAAEAKAAEEIGLERKDIDEDEAGTPESEAETAVEEEASEETESKEVAEENDEPLTRKEIVDAFSVVVQSLTKSVNENFDKLNKRIDEVEKGVEKEVDKKLTDIPAASIAGMLSKRLSISGSEGEDLESVEVDGRTKLARQKPKEAEVEADARTGIPFIDKMLSEEGVK